MFKAADEEGAIGKAQTSRPDKNDLELWGSVLKCPVCAQSLVF